MLSMSITGDDIFNVFSTLENITKSIANIVPLVFVLFGLLAVIFYLSSHFSVRFGKKYTKTTAKIIKAELTERLGVNHRLLYGVSVEYEYVFNGIKYVNSKIYRLVDSFSSSDKSLAQSFYKKSQIGSDVVVNVDSLNPANAYLLEKPPAQGFLLVLGLIMIFIGLAIFFYW